MTDHADEAAAEPADTTMMRIVHDALRRDVARAQAILSDPERVGPDQRRAIGAHLVWLTQLLEAHHRSEDLGLYPLLRARTTDDAAAIAVLDRMAQDHQEVAAAMETVATTATTLVSDPVDDAVCDAAAAAVDRLALLLLPHLRAEEDEAMPLATRLASADEWQAIEKEHNLDPKSMSELGFEGHWLIDGASDEDRAIVLHLVPPIPRFVLLHGFARRYRRHAARCWRGPAPSRRVQTDNHVSVTVPAAVDAVWDVVRDVTRVGEWSNECTGAEWLDGATSASPGARFRGHNRARRVLRWGRVCEVLAIDRHELRWRTVPTALYPDSAEWRISLAEGPEGTTITQSFHVLRAPPKVLAVGYALLIPSHRDRTAELIEDLRRLGAVASASRAAEGSPGNVAPAEVAEQIV